MIRATLFAFLFSSITSFAQSETNTPIANYKLTKLDNFYVDQFQNLYVVNNAELRKYDPTYKQLYSYSNPIKGAINQVDVLNALNPYIFYKDWNEVVVVDNRLNASTAINFNDYGFLDVLFISFADQDNVWFYDQGTDKLYRFNLQSKKVINSSLNITQLIGAENTPQSMVSTINKVYLNIPEKGILLFDALGSLQKNIPLKDVESFCVQGNELYYVQHDQVYLYNLNTSLVDLLDLKDKKVENVRIGGKRLYISNKEGIGVYQLPISISKQ